MELYTTKDIEVVNENIDGIIEKIESKKLEILEPTKTELMAINKIIMDYIKDNKLKIYGGFAQNKLVYVKDPNDAFYNENDIPDIDVYSPDPLKDVVTLCDILHKKGYKYVQGKEALHKETYKIFVNFADVCDLSYVPRNIYHKIPFITVDGINYTHPSFTYIDLYRMMSEPYFSSFRWKKIFPRLYVLQKHYPFNPATQKLNNAYNVPTAKKSIVSQMNRFIYDEIKNKESFVVVGQYAYNYLLEESGIMKNTKLKQKYNLIDIPFFQLISTNYIQDTTNMILNLKYKFPQIQDKITFTEFYPLWMFTGYNTVIYYDQIPICYITSYNNRATPIQKVKAKIYSNGNSSMDGDNYLQLGSFDLIFLMNLVTAFRARVNMIEDKYHYHNIMTSQLIEMRNYYLEKNKKTLLDDTIFKSFVTETVGKIIDIMRETSISRDKKYKQGKLVIFKYDPSNPKPPPDYKFANTSGNEIRKPMNLKITKYVHKPELLQQFDNKQVFDIDENDEEIDEYENK